MPPLRRLDRRGSRHLLGPRIHLAPMERPTSAAELEVQTGLLASVQCCLGAAWEPSTRTRYEHALGATVGNLEAKTGLCLLPLDSEDKLMMLFASLDRQPWGTVGVVKCAVRAWHQERSLSSVYESAWTDRAILFWQGLKKRADHSHA